MFRHIMVFRFNPFKWNSLAVRLKSLTFYVLSSYYNFGVHWILIGGDMFGTSKNVSDHSPFQIQHSNANAKCLSQSINWKSMWDLKSDARKYDTSVVVSPMNVILDGPNKCLPSWTHYTEFTINELNIQRQQGKRRSKGKLNKKRPSRKEAYISYVG